MGLIKKLFKDDQDKSLKKKIKSLKKILRKFEKKKVAICVELEKDATKKEVKHLKKKQAFIEKELEKGASILQKMLKESGEE